MTTLLESVSEQITPETLGTIGKAIGVDEATVQKVLEVIGPVIQGAWPRRARRRLAWTRS